MTLLINPAQEPVTLQESIGNRSKISQNFCTQNLFQFWLACRNFKAHFNDRSLNSSYLLAKDIHKTFLKHYNSSSIKCFTEKSDRNIIKDKLKNFHDLINRPNLLKSIFDSIQGKIAQILSQYLPNFFPNIHTKSSNDFGKFKPTQVRLLAEKSPHDFANLLIRKLELIIPEQSIANTKCQFSLMGLIKNLQCNKRLSPSISSMENVDPQEILDYHCKRVWPEEDFFINKDKFNLSYKTSLDPWILFPNYKNSNKSLEDSAFTSSCSSVFGY